MNGYTALGAFVAGFMGTKVIAALGAETVARRAGAAKEGEEVEVGDDGKDWRKNPEGNDPDAKVQPQIQHCTGRQHDHMRIRAGGFLKAEGKPRERAVVEAAINVFGIDAARAEFAGCLSVGIRREFERDNKDAMRDEGNRLAKIGTAVPVDDFRGVNAGDPEGDGCEKTQG